MLDDMLKSDQQFLFYVSKNHLTEEAILFKVSESGGFKDEQTPSSLSPHKQFKL